MRRERVVVAAVLVLSLCGFAFGAEDAGQDANVTSLTLGPGVVMTSKPYKGMDAKAYPIPLIMYKSGRFFISGATAGYRLLAGESWTFDAVGKWRFDGYDEDDSDDLEGMGDRHMTVDIGGAFSVFGDWGTLKVTALKDALSEYDGEEMSVSYSRTFQEDKLGITPFVGFSWLSNDLADYYYGVRSDETKVGRPAYSAGSGVNWFAGLGTDYKLDEKWSLFAQFSYEWLNNEITDSPIVDDDYEISILAGAMYKF